MLSPALLFLILLNGCSQPADRVGDNSTDPSVDTTIIEQVAVVSDHQEPLEQAVPAPLVIDGTVNEKYPMADEHATNVEFDHAVWEKLLQTHVSPDGMVDYAAIGRDPQFANYLKKLSEARPSTAWSVNERKAFWINVYNAFIIKLIIDNPGVKSIKDISSPWRTEFFSIGGVKMDLDHVEHTELRKNLKDPRIHFGIVCASFSCPQLWNHAYTAAALDKQLDDAARRFINDPLRNKITGSTVELSKIFDWFKGDFMEDGTLIAFINRYAKTPIPRDANVDYLDYDWRLNGK